MREFTPTSESLLGYKARSLTFPSLNNESNLPCHYEGVVTPAVEHVFDPQSPDIPASMSLRYKLEKLFALYRSG